MPWLERTATWSTYRDTGETVPIAQELHRPRLAADGLTCVNEVLGSLRSTQTPDVRSFGWPAGAWPTTPDADVVGRHVVFDRRRAGDYSHPWNRRVEEVPPPPETSGTPQVRDEEIAQLRRVKNATAVVGAHVL